MRQCICWECFRASSDKRGCPRVQSIAPQKEEVLVKGSKVIPSEVNVKGQLFIYDILRECPMFIADGDTEKIRRVAVEDLKLKGDEIQKFMKHFGTKHEGYWFEEIDEDEGDIYFDSDDSSELQRLISNILDDWRD